MEPTAHTATDEDRRKLFSLIRDIHVAMLTTMDDDGQLRARPMGNKQEEFGDELHFLTPASAHKALEIGKDCRVCVSFTDPGLHTYVSVSGSGRLVRDRQKAEALWTPYAKIWFPEGLDDPDLAVLLVEVEKAEYWDSPSGAFVAVYGLLAQALTGQPPKLGDNEKIDFN